MSRPSIDDEGRAFFLHAYQRTVNGRRLTPLDVWEVARGEPQRLYVAVPEEAFENMTWVRLMTTTASGDLLIIDVENEALLRFDAANLERAIEASPQR